MSTSAEILTALEESPVRLWVPATSANLGPGYDSFGLAHSLYDHLTLSVHPESDDLRHRVHITGEGAEVLPRDHRHLVLRIVSEVVAAHGFSVGDELALTAHNAIPQSRGLGSSAAATVAGIGLAFGLLDRIEATAGVKNRVLTPGRALEALRWAVHYEGHPDNAAPALYGGVTISTMRGGVPHTYPLQVHPDIRTVVVIPEESLHTEKAREMLPATVGHAEAAANSAAAGVLALALMSNPEVLCAGTVDYLHQNYRRPAMPRTLDRIDALREKGLAAVVSGAGPTVLVLGTGDDLEARVKNVLSGDSARIVQTSIAATGLVYADK